MRRRVVHSSSRSSEAYSSQERILCEIGLENRVARVRADASEMHSAITLKAMLLDMVVAPMRIAALHDRMPCFMLFVCMAAMLKNAAHGDLPDSPAARLHNALLKSAPSKHRVGAC